MTKPVIVTRLGKGSELTFQEGDDNFTNLQNATISVSGDSGTTQNIDLNGTIAVAGGTGLSTQTSSGTVTVNLDNTAVTSGSYTNSNITVDAQGRITSAANGFSGSYTDLTDKPTLFSGAYADLSGAPSLATVATSGSYTDLSGTPTIPTNNNQLTNGAGYITGIDSSAVTTALGFTPESSSNKNQNNGYAGLDSNGKVASAQLPSYVDDVEEYADFANLPVTGETGKIYVAQDNGKIYRWSGSAYVEISPSPGSTDSVTEGSTNLYFTTSRARDAFSAGTSISITDGVIAVSGSLGATELNNLSDVDYSGAGIQAGDILKWTTGAGGNYFTNAQNNLSGISDVKDMMSPSDGDVLTWSSSNSQWENIAGVSNLDSLSDVTISTPSTGQVLTYTMSGGWENQNAPAGGIASLSADTNPALGGNLDVADYAIVNTLTNGNITLTPDGTGKTVVNNINYYETPYALTYSSTITPNVTNGTVQIVTLTGNVTFSAFSSPIAGQSITLIVKQDGTGSRTLTSTMKFSGGAKTLTTAANSIDIISVFYDGTNYWASLSTDFK